MLFERRRRPRPADTTAIVLAGGQSARFGATKGLALLAGEPLVLWVARAAAAAAGQIVLSLPHDADPAPWYDALGGLPPGTRAPLVAVCDEKPFAGPVAGVASALPEARDPYVLLLAVDMPLVPPDLLLGLGERLSGHDVVLFHLEGWWQTMPALWRRRSLDEALDNAQATGGRSLHSLVETVDARPLGQEYFTLFADEPTPLLSVDTTHDLARAEAWLAGRRGQ